MTTMATATVKGGFWPTNGVNTLASMSGESEERRAIARMFGHKSQMANRRLFTVLLGAAPGATATVNYTRVSAAEELGGARPIETQVLINRASTAADVTELTADYLTYSTRTTFGASPPANLDRNPLGTR